MGDHETYTIHELAERVGMTARNIRAYGTRQLLPPPLRQGRAASYDGRHLTRLLHIRELRTAGIPLGIIADAARHGADLGPDGELGRLVSSRRRRAGAARSIPTQGTARGPGQAQQLDPRVITRLGDDAALLRQLVASGVISGTGAQLFASSEICGALASLLGYGVEPAPALRVALHAAQTTKSLADVVTEVLSDAGDAISPAAHEAMVQLSIGVVRDTLSREVPHLAW